MYIKLESYSKVYRVFHDGIEWYAECESGDAYCLTDHVDQQWVRENICYVLEFPNGSYIIADEIEANSLLKS